MSAKILICDNAVDYAENFCTALEGFGMSCRLCIADGSKMLSAIFEYKPDIVLCGAVMSVYDAASLIEKITLESDLNPFFVVTSAYKNAFLEMEIMSFSNAYLMMSPFDADIFAKVVRRIFSMYHPEELKPSEENVRAELAVTGTLHRLGVPVHMKGYRYIRESVMLALDNIEMLDCITKVLYAEVAKRCDTTVQRVERAIRTAIETAWKLGDLSEYGRLFSPSVSMKKPSNSEFIAAVTDNLRLRLMLEDVRAV